MELLKKLYKVYSPSGKERTMIKFIWNYTKRITGTKVETDAAGNLYITKGEAESYPCIVAHLDQVQDIVTEIGWTSLCSPKFLQAAGYKKFGYRETHGMMTDVQELKERGLQVSCINLSCGYYEPHTDHEFTIKKDLMSCLSLVEHIIENCTDTVPLRFSETGYGGLPENLH